MMPAVEPMFMEAEGESRKAWIITHSCSDLKRKLIFQQQIFKSIVGWFYPRGMTETVTLQDAERILFVDVHM